MTLTRAGCWPLLGWTLFFSVLTNLLMLTGPLFMLQVYDRVLGSRSEETLVALTALVAALYFAYGILDYVRGRVVARIGARLQLSGQAPVFDAAVSGKARGAQPSNDLDAVGALTGSSALLNVLDVPWTPLFIGAIFLFHPLLGLVAAAGAGVLFVNALLTQVATTRARQNARAAQGASLTFSAGAMAGADVIRAQGMLPAMRGRWAHLRNAATSAELNAGDRAGVFASGGKAFRLFLQSAVLAVGAWLVLRGELTAGAMIAASILLGRALAPLEQVIAQWDLLQRGMGAWRDLKALQPQQERYRSRAPIALPRPDARLTVSRVTLMRPGDDEPIVQGLDLSMVPGEVLGVLGPSGSGKSTFARLLVGAEAPTTGKIRLGGATLTQYGAEALGRHVGYLPQEVQLFEGTVAENIAQMTAEPDAGRVIEAARRAGVHALILGLPDGYDTQVRTLANRLSGGQKQRLALARALYGDPVLLVLDEPNSALDAEGSDALNRALLAHKANGGAAVVMTHRPSAISAADRLMVLESGRITALGPKAQVMKAMISNAADIRAVAAGGKRA
ncbi:MAG: type I secretion system permease/ATPase [Pseudomonadota bacterium]